MIVEVLLWSAAIFGVVSMLAILSDFCESCSEWLAYKRATNLDHLNYKPTVYGRRRNYYGL